MARYGILMFAVALVVGWLYARRADSSDGVIVVIWSGAAALLALGIGQIIGNGVDRARPYTAMPASHVLLARSADFSFPSDHATAAGAVAVGLLFAGRRYGSSMLGLVTCCVAVLLAVSRVYVGVHYPGDVIAGLGLGAAVAAAGMPVALWLLRPAVRWLDHTPARVLVGGTRPLSPASEDTGRVSAE
ncbi:MAG: phosphatase PAP2 family protein [Acidimicrobiales bacterium]